jgi:hypothetical protein
MTVVCVVPRDRESGLRKRDRSQGEEVKVEVEIRDDSMVVDEWGSQRSRCSVWWQSYYVDERGTLDTTGILIAKDIAIRQAKETWPGATSYKCKLLK